jgi:hypothetical protein
MNTFFRAIRDYLKPVVPDVIPPPYELTDGEIRMLQEMQTHEGWDVFLTVLDRRSTLEGEGMLTARDSTVLHEARGRVLGLRIAGGLIDEIAQRDKMREETDERRRSSSADAARRTTAAIYATPAWK